MRAIILSMLLTFALAGEAKLKVQSFTANEAGFLVASHLIVGKKDAILVDAQFTRSQAKALAEMIKKTGKNLSTVVITHAHPDHYLGLEIIKKEFPAAKILADAAVIKGITETAAGKIKYWKTNYKDELADNFVTPDTLTVKEFDLDGEKIQLHTLTNGEAEASTVLYIPTLKAVITGDLAYNKVHLWLAENRPDGWLTNLSEIQKLGAIQKVYPGHGSDGDQKLLKQNEAYINEFVKVTAKPATKEAATAELKKHYPKYKLPIIAEISVGSRVK